MNASDKLAEKVLLYLAGFDGNGTVEDAVMTFAEDGSTWQELIDLAREVQESRQLNLPKPVASLSQESSPARICRHGYKDGAFGGCEECERPNRIDYACRVCGANTDIAPDPPAKPICPKCCEDHDYEYQRELRGHYCNHCGEEAPRDWVDD
jgi:hypothetical protein